MQETTQDRARRILNRLCKTFTLTSHTYRGSRSIMGVSGTEAFTITMNIRHRSKCPLCGQKVYAPCTCT